MDYVDVIFAHRPDPTSTFRSSEMYELTYTYIVVPMEEVVRAFNWVIEKGWV